MTLVFSAKEDFLRNLSFFKSTYLDIFIALYHNVDPEFLSNCAFLALKTAKEYNDTLKLGDEVNLPKNIEPKKIWYNSVSGKKYRFLISNHIKTNNLYYVIQVDPDSSLKGLFEDFINNTEIINNLSNDVYHQYWWKDGIKHSQI
jgi:hypothetical protein